MKYARYILAVVMAVLVIYILTRKQEPGPYISIAGFTQGTTYHMTYQSPKQDSLNLKNEIDALLADFDQSLSTYIDTSLISRINKNEVQEVDDYFETVYHEARRVYEISEGAFDITVGPLIDAWGFGPGMKMEMSSNVIDSLLQFVGMDKVAMEGGRIIKQVPELRFDLNAIAQGYAVDIVCGFLDELKIDNYMVEIGGEIRTKGISARGDSWRLGIDKPVFGNQIPGESLQEIVHLDDRALASSGNYRKYYEVEGQKIVHTVDPKTGYTRMSNLLSATIIADNCMTADALATSCMALGLEKARSFIEEQENVEALLIYSDEKGMYLEWMTEGMKEIIQ